jgi:hypothetical protein
MTTRAQSHIKAANLLHVASQLNQIKFIEIIIIIIIFHKRIMFLFTFIDHTHVCWYDICVINRFEM